MTEAAVSDSTEAATLFKVASSLCEVADMLCELRELIDGDGVKAVPRWVCIGATEAAEERVMNVARWLDARAEASAKGAPA